jgi:hypothetical protein
MRAAHSTRSKKVRQASPLRVPTGLFAVHDQAYAQIVAAAEHESDLER